MYYSFILFKIHSGLTRQIITKNSKTKITTKYHF